MAFLAAVPGPVRYHNPDFDDGIFILAKMPPTHLSVEDFASNYLFSLDLRHMHAIDRIGL